MKNKWKGGFIMENVIETFENMIDITNSNEKTEYTKFDAFLIWLKMKKLSKTKKAQQMMNKHIEILDGKKFLKGTRISVESIGNFAFSNDIIDPEELLKEYPSLKNREQVVTAMFYYAVDNINPIKLLLGK